jgi:hypothetical protein
MTVETIAAVSAHIPDHAHGDIVVLQTVWARAIHRHDRSQTGIKQIATPKFRSSRIGAANAVSSSSMRGLTNGRC